MGNSPAAERLRRLVLSKEELDLSETASIVESEDGVYQIQINPDQIQIQSSEGMFKQVIEVKDTLDDELHRKAGSPVKESFNLDASWETRRIKTKKTRPWPISAP